MGVSVYAKKGKDLFIGIDSVDMNYHNFYGLMEELNFAAETPDGTCGSLPIHIFRDALEANWCSMFPEHTILLLKLCRIGIEHGADTISWA